MPLPVPGDETGESPVVGVVMTMTLGIGLFLSTELRVQGVLESTIGITPASVERNGRHPVQSKSQAAIAFRTPSTVRDPDAEDVEAVPAFGAGEKIH